ncbi:MAG: hypothetical protein ACPG8W_24375 [Candidatus Promineifilaceae bacterium]
MQLIEKNKLGFTISLIGIIVAVLLSFFVQPRIEGARLAGENQPFFGGIVQVGIGEDAPYVYPEGRVMSTAYNADALLLLNNISDTAATIESGNCSWDIRANPYPGTTRNLAVGVDALLYSPTPGYYPITYTIGTQPPLVGFVKIDTDYPQQPNLTVPTGYIYQGVTLENNCVQGVVPLSSEPTHYPLYSPILAKPDPEAETE